MRFKQRLVDLPLVDRDRFFDAHLDYFLALDAIFLRQLLARVRVPALVIWGARDTALPIADGINYARRIGAPLRVLADTGTLAIAERPAECARLIDAFVAGLET